MAGKMVVIGLIFLFLINLAQAGYCEDNAIKKLGRGVCNAGTCFVELFVQPARVNSTNGPLAAATYGVLQGVAMTGFRAVVGVYEIATFPIPVPKGYKAILTNPEFFMEDVCW